MSFCSCIRKTLLDDVNYVESYTDYSFRKMVSPSFYFDALGFYKNGEGRTDIYLKVGYDKLVFLKESGINIARYNCSIRIINEENDSLIVDDEFEKKIVEQSLNAKVSDFFDFILKSYKLPRGSFIVRVKISDLNSSKYFSKLDRVIIDFSEDSSLQSSDLLLVHKVVNENKGQLRISPIVSKHIPCLERDTIFSFFEIYSKEKQTVTIDMELAQLKYAADNESDFMMSYSSHYQFYDKPWQIADYNKIALKNYTMDLVPSSNQMILPVPIGRSSGNYLLLYKIKSISGKDSVVKFIRFNVLPEGFPKIITLEDKIAVSKLVRQPGEKDYFQDSLSFKDRYNKLEEFWSQSNAWSREEFFKRAELANERFTSIVEGWKTPMGRVYIVCGEPETIDGDRWIYQDNIAFIFNVVRDRGSYSVEIPMVTLAGYTANAYNFWQRMINKIRTE
jgi:GWxTD domain-containing protein